MRISISIVASTVQLDTDLIPLDVFPDMTINDIKALVSSDINVPATLQRFFYNGQPIQDSSLTLTQMNIGEGDLLSLVIQDPQDANRGRRSQGTGAANRAGQQSGDGPDPERLRLHIAGDARMRTQVQNQDPELAAAANDRERFHRLWQQRQEQLAAAQAEKEAQLQLLNSDPLNVEAQIKIEEMIRQERVQENVQKALEENPESFGRVTMLYIDVLVNNVPIKAFVDSGAQTTIMSPDAAQRCGIWRLIDARYGGVARGVGTAKILGRVHSADIQIGQYNLSSSFTVMEGKDVDLLLGLDMLKRHQMCIDLRQNCLTVQDEQIPFLPENELPKMMDEVLENEPKIPGPEGTSIGAKTGTVEQHEHKAGSASSAQASSSSSAGATRKINIHSAGSAGHVANRFNAAASTSTAAVPQRRENTLSSGQPQAITEESITKLTDLGFTREEAVLALQQAGGNADLAASLLL